MTKRAATDEAKMTDAEAREVFNKAYTATTDPDDRARIELMREYFCNPAFRKALADHCFALTYTR